MPWTGSEMGTLKEKLAYLAAFIDGEGWITCRRCGGTQKLQRRIGFTNTNKALFERVIGYAREAGLRFAVRTRSSANAAHSPRWDAYLVGGRHAFQRFAELVPLSHAGKRQRLLDILAQYCSVEEAGRRRERGRTARTTPERRKEISRIAHAAKATYAVDRAAV